MAPVARGVAAVSWVAGPESDRVSSLRWSVPFFRLGSTRYRLHWIFIGYAAVVLLRSFLGPAGSDGGGAAPAAPAGMAIAVVSVLVLVTIRELVRTVVVKSSGGFADDVVLWPLGATEGYDCRSGWRSLMAAAIAGPCASIAVFAALAVPIGLATGDWREGAFPNPFSDAWLRNPHNRWVEVAWVVHQTNVQLALLCLLPMVPLDGGMAATALLTRRTGAHEAVKSASQFSLVVAAAVAAMAIVGNLMVVLAAALACFVHSAMALRRFQLGDAMRRAVRPSPWDEDEERPAFRRPMVDEDELAAQARERERAEREAESRELDRILQKIADRGIETLTEAEHAALRKATESRRKGPPPKAR